MLPRSLPQLCRTALILAGLLIAAGCGSQGAPEPAAVVLQPVDGIKLRTLQEPLTTAEVAAFLKVVAQLPGQTVPEFARLETSPVRLESLRNDLIQLQQNCRDGLDSARQGAEWNRDMQLQPIFERLMVDPEAFASLTARISCSLARLAFHSEADLREWRIRSEMRLRELVAALERPSLAIGPAELEFSLQQLEETMALMEFLRLLEQVPAENSMALQMAGAQLQTCLPASNPLAKFERRVESNAPILQIGYER